MLTKIRLIATQNNLEYMAHINAHKEFWVSKFYEMGRVIGMKWNCNRGCMIPEKKNLEDEDLYIWEENDITFNIDATNDLEWICSRIKMQIETMSNKQCEKAIESLENLHPMDLIKLAYLKTWKTWT